jgi:peptide/nickel transport system permease protein
MLSRLLYGGRTTLGLAAASTALAFIIGVGCGLAAAVMGSWVDMALSRLVDALMALPTLIIALIVLSVLGSSIPVLIGVIAVLEATRFFRVARGAGLAVAAMDYVEVARLRGEGLLWLVRREVLINILGVVMTETALRFGFIILFISGLSFLGLGVQPPHADWGSMVRENAIALNFGRSAPLVPAIAIAGITIALNMLVGTTGVRRSSR